MVTNTRCIVSVLVALTFIVAGACEVSAQSLRPAPVVVGTDWTAEASAHGTADGAADSGYKIPDDPAFLQNEGSQGISSTRAMMYSLLLPGLGQWKAGDKSQAKLFFGIEGAIWISFAVFSVQGYVREEDYIDYAQVFAGISSADHSDDYYSVIGEYNSWIPYEAYVKSEGRYEFYPNVDTQSLENYFVDNRVSDYEPWVWQSADVRRNFRDQRSASRRSYRRAEYALAAALMNRVASAFFAIGAAKKSNQPLETGYRLEIGAPWERPNAGFRTGVSVIKNF